jgi:hypothetical protein
MEAGEFLFDAHGRARYRRARVGSQLGRGPLQWFLQVPLWFLIWFLISIGFLHGSSGMVCFILVLSLFSV